MRRACFVAGTVVETRNGLRAIDRLAIGDQVLSRHEETGEIAYRSVVRTIVIEDKQTYRLVVADQAGVRETIRTTDEHPFWIVDHGWVRAADLREGDPLLTSSGADRVVVSLDAEEEQETVYNIEVDEFHTYFVGESRIFVHNADCGEVEIVQNNVVTRKVGQNTVHYIQNAAGDTISAKGSLREDFGGGKRSSAEVKAQSDSAASGVTADQGGHMVGYIFMPEQGDINMFPQNGNFNVSAFKTMENDYARYIKEGYQVDFEHTLGKFDPVTGRPDTVHVDFTVRDTAGNVVDSHSQLFNNAAWQNYVRRI